MFIPQLSPTSGLSVMILVIVTVIVFIFSFSMMNTQKLYF